MATITLNNIRAAMVAMLDVVELSIDWNDLLEGKYKYYHTYGQDTRLCQHPHPLVFMSDENMNNLENRRLERGGIIPHPMLAAGTALFPIGVAPVGYDAIHLLKMIVAIGVTTQKINTDGSENDNDNDSAAYPNQPNLTDLSNELEGRIPNEWINQGLSLLHLIQSRAIELTVHEKLFLKGNINFPGTFTIPETVARGANIMPLGQQIDILGGIHRFIDGVMDAHLVAVRDNLLGIPTVVPPGPTVTLPAPPGPEVAPPGPAVAPPRPAVAPQRPAVAPPRPAVAPPGPAVAPQRPPAVAPQRPAVAPQRPAVAPPGPEVAPPGPAVAPQRPAVALADNPEAFVAQFLAGGGVINEQSTAAMFDAANAAGGVANANALSDTISVATGGNIPGL